MALGMRNANRGNIDMLNGTETFRDSFRNVINSWTVSIPEIISVMEKNIKLDPHFSLFVE